MSEHQLPPLVSNGRTLDMRPHRLGRIEPTPASTSVETIRERLLADGHVWLRGFLDRDDVLAFRRHVFTAFADTGLVAAGSDPVDGICGSEERPELTRRRLMEIVRSAAFESFCLQPRLWQFMDQLMAGPSYLHKRKLLRHTRPSDHWATPAHYDLVYLRGGTNRIVTAWIPIGDVPVEMGGLCYLEGSDALGRRMEAEFVAEAGDLAPEERVNAYNRKMKAGGMVSDDLPDLAERTDSRWLVADYEAGDVMLHSPYMIHAATMNTSRDNRIRLSTDIRYQSVRDEIDARWANHWALDDML